MSFTKYKKKGDKMAPWDTPDITVEELPFYRYFLASFVKLMSDP